MYVEGPFKGDIGLAHTVPSRKIYQGFQTCTPRVVALGFGILSRKLRGLYEGCKIKALWWKPFGGTELARSPPNPYSLKKKNHDVNIYIYSK